MAPVVLGAGPAGCAAAIALARGGARPLLLDRDAEARDPLCGGFLSWRTAAQLAALGLDPARLGARRVDRLALFAATREIAVPLPRACFALSRRTLDAAMRQAALAAGARLEIDTARSLDGTAVLGRRRRWPGDGLFLATGKHDVRGLPRPRAARDPALGLRLRLPATPARAALLAGRIELHLFDGGYAGVVLQEDGSANVCLAVRKSRLGRAGGEPGQLLARLGDENPAFGRRLAQDWQFGPIETIGAVPYGWFARRTSAGLFRLGDQAAVIPSLAGEGLSIAVASGVAAARYWLARGPAGAPAYQREMAARVAGPLQAARLVRAVAETPSTAALGLRLARHCPALVHGLMRLSRLSPEAALAPAPHAP